jgi:hypothetical protein
MDPLNALATFVLGRIKEGLYAQWLKFLFELGFSAVGSFLITAGAVLTSSAAATLLKGTPFPAVVIWSFALGSGFTAAAVSMIVLFRRESSRLTKGMLVVFPSAEAAIELAANLQSIQKPEEKKLL